MHCSQPMPLPKALYIFPNQYSISYAPPYTLPNLRCAPTHIAPLAIPCAFFLTHKAPKPIPFPHVLFLTCMAFLAHSVTLPNLCHPLMHPPWISGTSCTPLQLSCLFPDPLHSPFDWPWTCNFLLASPVTLTLQTSHRQTKWRSWQYREGEREIMTGRKGRKEEKYLILPSSFPKRNSVGKPEESQK